MTVPSSAHTSRAWRIHELTQDFRVEDVWRLPAAGALADFPRLVAGFASGDPSHSAPGAVRALWAIRSKLGALLGWDTPGARDSGPPSLRERMPADLRGAARGPDFGALPFTPLYMLEDEWAAEIVNRTVHAVMHLGWIPDGHGLYRGQMAVLVKPAGLLGSAYMAAIKPARRLIVYPAMMRRIERTWHTAPTAG